MKKLLAIVVLLTAPAWATIATTAHGGQAGASSSPATIAVTVTVASGDSIVGGCSLVPTTASVSSVSDNGSPSGTYVKQASQSTNEYTDTWTNLSPSYSTQPTTVTFTLSGATAGQCTVETYTGVQAIGVNATSSGSATPCSGTLTTEDANNWVHLECGAPSNTTWSATNPTVVRHSGHQATVGTAGGDNANNASAGSVTVSFSMGTSGTWGSVAVELRSIAPASGCANYITLMGAGCK